MSCTLIVKSTQGSSKETISDFPTQEYSSQTFIGALGEVLSNLSVSGMSVSITDMDDVEDGPIILRGSDGSLDEDGVITEEGKIYLVSLNPKSTSNG